MLKLARTTIFGIGSEYRRAAGRGSGVVAFRQIVEELHISANTVQEHLTAAEPKQRALLKGHTFALSGVVFSADGKLLASSGADGRVLVYDSASGKPLHEWKMPGHVTSIAFAPDSRHLASANGNGTIYFLRLAVK